MALLVWWLVPVGLFVVVILILIGQRSSHKPPLYLIEPFGLMISSWRLVRRQGDENKLAQVQQWLERTSQVHTGLLNQIISGPTLAPTLTADYISHQALPLLGERQLVRVEGKVYSIVIGLLPEVQPHLLLAPAEMEQLQELGQVAAEHGYLILNVGLSVVHGAVTQSSALLHPLVGSFLFEPVLNEVMMTKLAKIGPRKILTLLPTGLATFLADKLGEHVGAVSLAQHRSVIKLEAAVNKADVLAEADHDQKYHALRLLQLQYGCRLISNFETDQMLPVRRLNPATIFPPKTSGKI